MKRTALSLLIAAVVAGGFVVGMPNTAKADHRRHRVGVFVGSGGISVGIGHARPIRYHSYGYYRPTVFAPVIAPVSCCSYQQVYVPEHWDAFGWHPGYFQTYRVCDHHGRVFIR